MSNPGAPLQSAHDIGMSVYRDSGHDFELSCALEQIADPGNLTVITPGRVATADILVPSVTSLHLSLDGAITHSTTTFAMSEEATEESDATGDSWINALRQGARQGVLASTQINLAAKQDVFFGSQHRGACLIGGLAVAFNKQDKTIAPVEFVSSSVVESIRDRYSGALSKVAMRGAVALAKLRSGNRGQDFDPALVNAVEFMKLAAVQSTPRASSPTQVSRRLFLTI